MDWPSNSPDLNPIENLWAIVKENVERRMSKNLSDLERFMAEEQKNIPETVIINLAGSMRWRCELLLKIIEKESPINFILLKSADLQLSNKKIFVRFGTVFVK